MFMHVLCASESHHKGPGLSQASTSMVPGASELKGGVHVAGWPYSIASLHDAFVECLLSCVDRLLFVGTHTHTHTPACTHHIHTRARTQTHTDITILSDLDLLQLQ